MTRPYLFMDAKRRTNFNPSASIFKYLNRTTTCHIYNILIRFFEKK